jgi:histidinol phosphatase-like enzyme (inositol monophosphatase family)
MSAFGFSKKVTVSARESGEYLRFAQRVVRQAGQATLPFFRADVRVENKLEGDFDPVTEADKAAERIIRDAVEATYPAHGIFGEEFGHQSGNGLTWVIDPIDGTKAFMTGMLHWGVLVGLFDGEQPVIGVMYQPYTDELFYGDGESAWFRRGSDDERRLSTSACDELSAAIMATTGIRFYHGEAVESFNRMVDATRMCRLGGDCYLYATLALGYLDIVSESSLHPFDIQPVIPIVRGAGGVVTTFTGDDASMGGSVVASANKLLHKQILDLIND